jgi:endonuclease/exonuclease/phosphatase family metal-dependent hydrolase
MQAPAPRASIARRLARWALRVGAALLGLVVLLLVVLLLLEWRPPVEEDTPIQGGPASQPLPTAELRLLSWNLGYAGLDREADFFVDGGTQSRAASRARVEENLAGLTAFLRAHPADALLLQEVDSPSSRSFDVDEVAALGAALPGHHLARAPNYRAAWVPVPLTRPLGRVESGLVTLTRARPSLARRLQLPGDFPWPVRVFQLKRCVHEVRLPAADGHPWAILHVHLATFDRGGALRRQQMDFLRALMQRRYAEGQHVIVGGDWNQAFPGLSERAFPASDPTPDWYQRVPDGWTPSGWTWAFDPRTPSLRAVSASYRPGQTFLTSVDGFLLGPDVALESVRVHDLGFRHSDHNPVELAVRLRAAR